MDKKEERLVQAVAALQAYCDDPRNPLSGPVLTELLNEFFAAADDIRKDAARPPAFSRRSELSPGPRPE